MVKDKIIRLSKNIIFVMMHFLNLDNNSFNTNSMSQIKLPRENILRSQVVSIGRRENPIWCCWRHPEDSYFESVRISSTQFVIARPGFLRSWQSHEVNLYYFFHSPPRPISPSPPRPLSVRISSFHLFPVSQFLKNSRIKT